MPSCSLIEHQGVSIVYIDAVHAKVSQAVEILAEGRRLIATFPRESVRLLTDATEATYSHDSINALRAFAIHNTPYVLASAVLGLDSIRMMALNSIRNITGRPIRAFHDRAQALNWLVLQEDSHLDLDRALSRWADRERA